MPIIGLPTTELIENKKNKVLVEKMLETLLKQENNPKQPTKEWMEHMIKHINKSIEEIKEDIKEGKNSDKLFLKQLQDSKLMNTKKIFFKPTKNPSSNRGGRKSRKQKKGGRKSRKSRKSRK